MCDAGYMPWMNEKLKKRQKLEIVRYALDEELIVLEDVVEQEPDDLRMQVKVENYQKILDKRAS